jgi:ADP-heptose:LPS heptosyltransferase
MRRDSGEKLVVPKMVSYFLKRAGREEPFSLPEGIIGSSKLLFIDSGDATDLLFAASVANWFHKRFPGIRTTLLVNSDDADIARSIFRVHSILTYDKKQLKFYTADYYALIRKLRQQRIDTVILLSRGISMERHTLAFATGAQMRIGFHHQLAFPFINLEVRISSRGYEGERMIRLIESLGLATGGVEREVIIPQADLNHARQLIHFRKPEKGVITVGIDPGRSKSRHRVIPEIIAYLANNLAGRMRVKFLVLTEPWDDKLVQKISGELKGEIIDLIPVNAGETIALLSQCDLFISGNTNLFHFASAMKIPTIGLFTKYDGKSWIPERMPNVRIFKGTKGEKLSLKSFFGKVEEVLAAGEEITV